MIEPPTLTRRALLASIGVLTGLTLTEGCSGELPPTLPQLPGFPVTEERRRLFDEHEQVMALYGATLPALTSAISDVPGQVGWMSGGFWRPPGVPTNARTQENVATLAWFYSQERPWNPYFRSPELLGLLNASVGYYLALQREDGAFPEGPDQSPRAATGFALIYLSQTYLLMQPHSWDGNVQQALLRGLSRAADWFLDPANDDVWKSAVYTSNQVVAGLLGAHMMAGQLSAVQLDRLEERLDRFLELSISPAGYLYEDRAVDFGYTIGVALGDLALLHTLTRDARLLEVAAQFLDFCSYNYLWEPDGSGFVVNGGFGSRQAVAFLDAERTDERSVIDLLALLADHVPIANAFLSTAEGRTALRTAWADNPSPIPPLDLGRVDPSRPRSVLAAPEFADRRTRMSELDAFRYRSEPDFVEERHDPRFDQHFVWIRRRGYFTSAFWGQRRGRQQSGLGFFYHPEAGTFVCAQSEPRLPWGRSAGGVEEADTVLTGRLTSENADPRLVLEAPEETSQRTLRCLPHRLEVECLDQGSFLERLPLVLQPTDEVSWQLPDGRRAAVVPDGDPVEGLGVEVRRGAHRLLLSLGSTTLLTLAATTASLFVPQSRTIAVLSIAGTDQLVYGLQVTS